MRRLLLIAVSLFVAATGCEENEPKKDLDVPEARAQFETISESLPLTLPPGWTLNTVNGRPYICGPIFDQHQANINLVVEPFRGTLDQYVEYSQLSLKKLASGCQFLGQTSFKTKGGIDGIRYSHEMTYNETKLRQTCYAFAVEKGEMHVFTCTVIASHGDELAPTFDQIIRTYKP